MTIITSKKGVPPISSLKLKTAMLSFQSKWRTPCPCCRAGKNCGSVSSSASRGCRSWKCRATGLGTKSPHNAGDGEESALEQEQSNEAVVVAGREKQPPAVVRKTFYKSEPITSAPVHSPPWSQSPTGLVMACAVLVAIRLGHQKSEDDRLDWRMLQLRQEKYESQHGELIKRRKEYAEQEAQQKAEDAARRVQEVQKQAAAEQEAKKIRDQKYKEEQEKEAQRLRAQKKAEQEAFRAQEDSMADELARRTQVEKEIIAEMEQKRLEEEEARRKEEEERLRLELERKQKAEEEERRKQEEELRVREIARQKLEKMKKKFAIRVKGSTMVGRAPAGAKTTGPVPKDAVISVELNANTVLVPEELAECEFYQGHEEAHGMAAILAGTVARQLADAYASSVRLQSIASTGPLELMDDIELEHWMRIVTIRCELAATHAIQECLQKHKDGRTSQAKQKFEVRTEWGVLPKGHEARTDTILNNIVGSTSDQDSKSVNREEITKMVGSESAALLQAIPDADDSFKYLALSTVVAHGLDRALAEGAASDEKESAEKWFREYLEESVAGAPKDSLLPQAEIVSRSLGPDHPVSSWMSVLASKNMSKAAKRAELEKQKLLEAELRAKVMQEEWPDREELVAARAKEAEENTPIPERVWAMRNVARTLSMGSSLSQAQALIEKSLRLQQEHFQSKDHPGMLATLVDYAQILAKTPENTGKAQSIWAEIIGIMELVADRYRKQGDLASAVICLESGIQAAEGYLGERSQLIKKISQKAESLRGALNPDEADKVAAQRRSGSGFASVMAAFTPELGVYKVAGKLNRLEEWDKGVQLTSLH